MNGDGSVLSKLLLGFMHLANEVNESLPRFGHALLRPIRELELSDRPGLAVLQTRRRISLNGEETTRQAWDHRDGAAARWGACVHSKE